MLRRDNNRRNRTNRTVVSIFDADLCLAVRPDEGEGAVLTNLCQPLRQLVRIIDGRGHQFIRLRAGEAKHHALVAGTGGVEQILACAFGFHRCVDAECNVRRLFVDTGHNGTGPIIKPHGGVVISDFVHGIADDGWNVRIAAGCDFASHQDHAGCRQGFTGHMRLRVGRQNSVQNAVRNGVAYFVGVPLCDGFGGKLSVFHRS